MSHVSKKTIAKYVEMVSTAGRVWTEGEIVSFRSLINTKLSDAPDVREMLVDRFHTSVELVPFQLEQSQQVKGLTWLHKTQLNSKAELRSAKTTFIGAYELNCIRNFSHFEFTGLVDVCTNSSSGYRAFVPVYRLYSASGAWFEYSATSSGACEVTNIGGPAAPRHLKAV